MILKLSSAGTTMFCLHFHVLSMALTSEADPQATNHFRNTPDLCADPQI